MNVTVFTDASRDPATGISGFGGWVVSNRGRLLLGGAFRSPFDSSTAAELAAVANTVTKAQLMGHLDPGDRILLQMDCKYGMRVIDGTRTPETPDERRVTETLRTLLGPFQVVLRFVRAHTGRKDPRHFINHFCDREAKRHMHAHRRQYRRALKASRNTPQVALTGPTQ